MNLPLPSASTVDPWPEIVALLPQKITYKGAPVNGDAATLKGFGGWLIQSLPAVVGDGDAEHKANCLLNWLRSETRYEADTATRMAQQAAAIPQAPANPISDQRVPQQAQLAPEPAAEANEPAETGAGFTCPACQTKVSGMRGFKRHVTMTHKVDWAAFCSTHGLDPKTCLPTGAAPAAAPAQSAAAPPPPPAASPVPPMFGAGAPPSPINPPTFVAAPVAPGQQSIPFAPPGTLFTPPAQGAPFVPPMVPPPPAAQFTPPSAPAMPQPGFVPAAPMPQQQAAFTPPPAPAPAPAPGPMVAFNPQAPSPAPSFPAQPQAGMLVGPGVAPPQAPASAPVPPPVPGSSPVALAAPSREAIAQMLGGAVDLIVVRLLDAAAVKLDGRADVNQLALLAEGRARQEMKVADLAQASYGQGKQAAQRHFADLLNQNPGCYLLLNGYDPILPDGYFPILAGRVTKFHLVTDGGRQTTTIF